jgi:type II secretory pathway predicted ATPase ExeA
LPELVSVQRARIARIVGCDPSPFGCLLVGQPTLRRRIKLGTFAALDQRIALRYAMAGMDPGETKGYLAHNAARPVMRRRCPDRPAAAALALEPSALFRAVRGRS